MPTSRTSPGASLQRSTRGSSAARSTTRAGTPRSPHPLELYGVGISPELAALGTRVIPSRHTALSGSIHAPEGLSAPRARDYAPSPPVRDPRRLRHTDFAGRPLRPASSRQPPFALHLRSLS